MYGFLSDWVRAKIRAQLEEIPVAAAHAMRHLDEGEPSEVLLGDAADLRRRTQQVEETLLEYHLQTCLLPEIKGLAEIGAAVRKLAESRIGALIAVERQDSLSERVRPGVSVDARLSAALLGSIFYPGNPLHDGGVIIRGERIAAAACVFPLAASVPEAHRKFGTRHRAAIGLSQASDALVMVVSEETGRASIALTGRLYTVSEPSRLLDDLLSISRQI